VKQSTQSGFTILEVLVAVVVLGIGIIALVGTSGFVTRQIGKSRIMTIANEVATRRLEQLKLAAAPAGAAAACTSANFASGGPVTSRGVTETWNVTNAGTLRTATVTVTYPRTNGTGTITLQTSIGCY